jgi:hypothetical protein
MPRIKMFTVTALSLIVVALGLALSPVRAGAAAADPEGYETNFPGTLQVVRRVIDTNGKVLEEEKDRPMTGLLKQRLDAAWAGDVDATCARIKARIAQRVADKLRPTRLVNCDLAESGELRARTSGSNLDLKYVTRGNVVTFWVTTPDVCVDIPIVGEVCAGAPRELDPKFTITFDTEMRIRVPVEGTPRPLKAAEATVLVRNAYMDSNNVTGDLAGGVDALIRAWGGKGFFADAEEEFNAERDDKIDDVNDSLALFDTPLVNAAKAGYERMRATIDGGAVVLELSKRVPALSVERPNIPLCLLLAGGCDDAEAELPYGPDTCKQGYVWREAFAGDTVCVTPQTRAQAAEDNAQAAARRSPNGGPYGPDTCKSGYVWREARPEDHVCVTPETRAQTANDNAQANQRRAVPR